MCDEEVRRALRRLFEFWPTEWADAQVHSTIGADVRGMLAAFVRDRMEASR